MIPRLAVADFKWNDPAMRKALNILIDRLSDVEDTDSSDSYLILYYYQAAAQTCNAYRCGPFLHVSGVVWSAC